MKNREKELLLQLLRNSKLSDREIAKKLKTSQSTITRNRHRLEKKVLVSYTSVPDLQKLGIKLIAITLCRCINPSSKSKDMMHVFRDSMPNIIFSGHGEGMGKTMAVVSLHNDFSDYTTFMSNLRQVSKDCFEDVESFLIPTDGFLRDLNFSNAVEYLIEKTDKSKIID
jgi:DNA-binding Lrp family transcriptional regulator